MLLTLLTITKNLCVFLDLAKAFDTVSHQILLTKLERAGIRSTAYNLLKTYLLDRKQQVRIGQCLSEEKTVECGVPQGTVLGPVLFVLYVNEILNVEVGGRPICYADDTAVIFEGSSWEETFKKAKAGMNKIKYMLDINVLTLNADKSHYIAFSIYNDPQCVKENLIIHENSCKRTPNCNCKLFIKPSGKVKYLGIYIDSHFKWNDHINYVVGKLRKCLYKFYQLREFLPLKLLKTVYSALIESILNYGILIWGAAYKNSLEPLYIIQKYILKIIYKKPKIYSTEQLFIDLQLLTVRQLFIKRVITYMQKSDNNYKKPLPHWIQTRSQTLKKVIFPKTQNNAAKHHISYIGPKLYNKIPDYYKIKNRRKHLGQWIQRNYEDIKKEFLW